MCTDSPDVGAPRGWLLCQLTAVPNTISVDKAMSNTMKSVPSVPLTSSRTGSAFPPSDRAITARECGSVSAELLW